MGYTAGWLSGVGRGSRWRAPARRKPAGVQAVSILDVPDAGVVVHLKGCGLGKLFKLVTPHGDIEHGATNDLEMTPPQRFHYVDFIWKIDSYHRGIKQCCGVQKAQVHSALAQRNHIRLALRAFLRLEGYAFITGIS